MTEIEEKQIDIIVPVSGGKDSTACLLLAVDKYSPDRVIPLHYYTGWDHPYTLKYLDYLGKYISRPIEYARYAAQETLPELIKHLGRWPTRIGRFCSDRYKRSAPNAWYKKNGFYNGRKGLTLLGIRANESNARRAKYGQYINTDRYNMIDVFSNTPKALAKNVEIMFPVLNWTANECFDYISSHGVNLNPLYESGDRVGCYPCLLASRKNQERDFKTDYGKKQLAIIRELQDEIGKYPLLDEEGSRCGLCEI